MADIAREHFYERLEGAPHAVRGFCESMIEHFQRDNMVKSHYTDTNGGDLRLAIAGEVLGQKMHRNFATLYCQTSKRVVFARTYLTPDELAVLGLGGAFKPKDKDERLKSDVHLEEEFWSCGAREFIRALQMAKIKF